MIYSP